MYKGTNSSDLAVVIEVKQAQGSVPRDTGTWMVVYSCDSTDFLDDIEGTIGGGHLEHVAIAKARELIGQTLSLVQGESGSSLVPLPNVTERYALGPSLGQCCGGVLQLRYQVIYAEQLTQIRETLQEPPPRFHLQLYGAGHVGQAIVRALEPIACSVDWIDEREAFLKSRTSTTPIFHSKQRATISQVCVDSPAFEVKRAPANSAFLVMTHSHALDLEIVTEILKRDDFTYLGLIGSKTKRARFEHQLKARDFPESVLQKLTCPIGVLGVAGKEPEIIAASVVAQLLQTFPPKI